MGSCSSQSAQGTRCANTLEERLLSSEGQASNKERMQECLSSESCSSQSAQNTHGEYTLDEGLLSSEVQSSNMEVLQECHSSWRFSGKTVNNRIESSDYNSFWLYGLNPLVIKEKVVTDLSDKQNIILNSSSTWEYLDVPLDVTFTEEAVEKYRLDQRWKRDQVFRKCQRKIFDKEFLAMTNQFPNILGRVSLPETIKPFEFHLKIARELSSLCLTAKEPLSSGYFNEIPMVVNEKILTYLTGRGVLHTRVVWISMRSELNKYDRAYIKDASTARAEASFLDRVAMNLFEQLNNRVKQWQINEEDQSFEEWRLNFVETVRLKRERRQALKKSNSPTEKQAKVAKFFIDGELEL